ncbi:hypothetical protein BGZ93_000932 [Podila epicladia]|nr:hypothetical protein BGZ92_008831 [Podila epicladia]KAG0098157.1 hypothetical protein BGZ93_000932 [Podila epicladia]
MRCPFPTSIFFIAVVMAQFLAVPAHADSCDNDCSTVTSKLLNCGSSDVDFLDVFKLDAAIDNCLCTNETINAFRGCETCHSIHKAVMNTDKLIADCKRVDPSRTYVATNNTNNSASNNRSMATKTHSSRVSTVVAIIAVGLALSLS